MVRLALTMLAAAALLLTACKSQPKATSSAQEPYTPNDRWDASSTETAADTDWYTAEPETTAWQTQPPVMPADEPLVPSGARTHVVRKGETLYELARRYYANQSRWRDIWQANRSQLPDPNKLRVGMELVIP